MVPFSPFPFMFLFVFVFYHVTVWMGSNKLNWTVENLQQSGYYTSHHTLTTLDCCLDGKFPSSHINIPGWKTLFPCVLYYIKLHYITLSYYLVYASLLSLLQLFFCLHVRLLYVIKYDLLTYFAYSRMCLRLNTSCRNVKKMYVILRNIKAT